MHVSVGHITINMTIRGIRSRDVEQILVKRFGPFMAPQASADFDLVFTPVPNITLNQLLPRNVYDIYCQVVAEIENRSPFTRIDPNWQANPTTVSNQVPIEAPVLSQCLSHYDTGNISVVPHGHFLVGIDHTNCQGEAIITGNTLKDFQMAIYLCVQAVLALIAPDHNGAMVHCGAGQLDGHGYMFPGVTGSGKSTLMRLFPEDAVLGEDSVLCVRSTDGFRLYPTPFNPSISTLSCSCWVPLKQVMFLIQDQRNWVSSLSPGTALAAFIHNHIHFSRFLAISRARALFSLLAALVHHVELSQLHFTRQLDPRSFFRRK